MQRLFLILTLLFVSVVTTACINNTILTTYTDFVLFTTDYYWSSTEYGVNSAYYVVMGNGFIDIRTKVNSAHYIRCVRDFVDSVDPVDPVDLPYVIFEDRALYIQPDQNTTQMNWTTAVAYCNNLDANGYSDWYLPSAIQLRVIWDTYTYQAGDNCLISGNITTACINNTILATNNNFESLISEWYWSSTVRGLNLANKMYVANGNVGGSYFSDNFYVRCVRD